MLAGAKELFVFMPLQHQRVYSIRRIFQTVLVQHPCAPCKAHTCQTVILRHDQVPGLHPVDECKIHTVSAFVKYQRLCPSRSIRWDVSHRITTGTPFSLRSAGSDRPPGNRLHRSKLSCAYSPSLIVLCFGLIIVPCSAVLFNTQEALILNAPQKAREAFPEIPRKNIPCLITVNQHAFPSARSPSGQRLFVQIVEKFGTDELQRLPHPLGKLHRSFLL